MAYYLLDSELVEAFKECLETRQRASAEDKTLLDRFLGSPIVQEGELKSLVAAKHDYENLVANLREVGISNWEITLLANPARITRESTKKAITDKIMAVLSEFHDFRSRLTSYGKLLQDLVIARQERKRREEGERQATQPGL